MPFVIFIFSFVFYRVIFKAGFDENISLVADLLISLMAGIAAFLITAAVSRSVYSAMIREVPLHKRDRMLFDSFKSFLIISAVFIAASFFVIYGFSDNLYDTIEYEDAGFIWASIFLAVAPVSHYLVTIVHSKRTFSKVLEAERMQDLE
jgi:hypothetical protein